MEVHDLEKRERGAAPSRRVRVGAYGLVIVVWAMALIAYAYEEVLTKCSIRVCGTTIVSTTQY